jgi:hypothetical protein
VLAGLFTMRVYFMIKVRRSGGRIMPDKQVVKQDGKRGFLVLFMATFFALLVFLGVYPAGMAWIEMFLFQLPDGLPWIGFALGIFSLAFMTCTKVTLDTK